MPGVPTPIRFFAETLDQIQDVHSNADHSRGGAAFLGPELDISEHVRHRRRPRPLRRGMKRLTDKVSKIVGVLLLLLYRYMCVEHLRCETDEWIYWMVYGLCV